jgi:hypothetical protein
MAENCISLQGRTQAMFDFMMVIESDSDVGTDAIFSLIRATGA